MTAERACGGQLPLALEQRPAYGREDFLVADSNRDALAWIESWPDWPARMIVLSGPEGSGKTHLAHVWQAMSDAVVVAADGIDPLTVGGTNQVIESVDEASDDVALFHALNRASEAGVHVLATTRVAPGQMQERLPDLVSRLRAMPCAKIGEPDDGLIAMVLAKLLHDCQLKAGQEVIDFLIRHMERSFDAARRIVAEADALSFAEHRRLTVPLVRRVLNR